VPHLSPARDTRPPLPDLHPLARFTRDRCSANILTDADRQLIFATACRAAAERFNVSVDLVTRRAKGRIMTAVWPRHVVWYILRTRTNLTPQAIARFAGCDHGTVMHGVGKVQDCISVYPTDAATVATLADELFGSATSVPSVPSC
jgi:chromosomal replication initiation ATPase DnaA